MDRRSLQFLRNRYGRGRFQVGNRNINSSNQGPYFLFVSSYYRSALEESISIEFGLCEEATLYNVDFFTVNPHLNSLESVLLYEEGFNIESQDYLENPFDYSIAFILDHLEKYSIRTLLTGTLPLQGSYHGLTRLVRTQNEEVIGMRNPVFKNSIHHQVRELALFLENQDISIRGRTLPNTEICM